MTPQQARAIGDFLTAEIEGEMKTTLRVIEHVPDGKLDYTPDSKSATALGLIRHLVVVDAWFLNCVANGAVAPDANDKALADGIMTPADGAARYRELVGAAFGRVCALSDEQLATELDFFGMMKLPAAGLLGMMLKHSIHHRGQLSAYLRAMGGKVPGIYGPSGDSQ